jgi:D-aminopeptidase
MNSSALTDDGRARARDLGLMPGRLPTGQANAISDVPGVRVGHATVIAGDDVRTGVTAIVHDDLLSGAAALPAGLSVFNGFGKMVGSTQLAELGTLETPVLLTATLSVFRVADALLSYLHELRWGVRSLGNEPGTLNPVVAETNDGYLSDIWARPITAEHVRMALETAASNTTASDTVAEGCAGIAVAAGAEEQGFERSSGGGAARLQGGSCVIVLATDAALGSRQLERVASRAFAGMARTGSDFSGRSGDYALAFSTAAGRAGAGSDEPVPDSDLDLLFTAAIEATEEAVLNSLFMATTTRGFRGHIRHAVPLDYVTARLRDRPRGDI